MIARTLRNIKTFNIFHAWDFLGFNPNLGSTLHYALLIHMADTKGILLIEGYVLKRLLLFMSMCTELHYFVKWKIEIYLDTRKPRKSTIQCL